MSQQHHETFVLLRAILSSVRPSDAAGALRRIREKARDQGDLGTWVDRTNRQYAELSKLGTTFPVLFRSFPFSGNLLEEYRQRGLYANCSEIWSAAFASDPTLADEMETQNRYNAACYAALAGCGKSRADDPFTEAARAPFRQQALAWLKADLIAWTTLLQSNKTENRVTVAKALHQWMVDTDLAGVRDGNHLEKLSGEERRAWQILWGDVDGLLKRAEAEKP